MGLRARTALIAAVVVAAWAPSAGAAVPAWTCSAGAGWIAAGGQRADAPGIGGDPCPSARADAASASEAGGSLAASGSLSLDGGAGSQTTDTRKPQAQVDAKSLTIRNADGSLTLTASKLRDDAGAACDANRNPAFTSSSSLGTVTLNGRSVDTSRDYSEPGVGVNGAPLFGKITIRFGEVDQSAGTAVARRAIHLIVTDRNGGVVFEAVAGQVAVGRDGSVCDPPPVCPPGTTPQQGRCVEVQVSPLPPPPPPVPQLPPPVGPGPSPSPSPPPGSHGCRDADARIGQVSAKRLRNSTLCLMNVQRARHHLRKLRLSVDLDLAATRHARNMVAGRYFAHDEPGGAPFVDRILHSGYLERYGRWHVGENLGWGWGSGGTPRAIVVAWMRSPPHRRNMLSKRFHDVGIAVRAGAPGRQPRPHSVTYVIDFGGFELVRSA